MKKVAKLQNQALLPALAGFLDREERLVHIVTPLCAGGELFHRIYEHGRVSEHLAATILRKLVLGVSDLHRVGILHCDIKCGACVARAWHRECDVRRLRSNVSHVRWRT